MIVLLLLAAVSAGAYYAGRNSRSYPPVEMARPPAEQPPARREFVRSPPPVWPWVVGAAALGVLMLGMAAGPPGLFGGPGLFAGLIGP